MEKESVNENDIKWIKRSLTDIKEEQKVIKDDMNEGFSKVHKRQDTANSRTSKLETRQMIIWGILSAIGISLLGLVFSLLNEFTRGII